MSRWTHNICVACWNRKNPDHQVTRRGNADLDNCCFCGLLNYDGIYIRHDPDQLPCKGVHPNF